MARPREFDESVVLDAAVNCFWTRGYEATSVRDLAAEMGITGPSLYNAFGDKRSLFRTALERYVQLWTRARIAEAEAEGTVPRECDAKDLARLLLGVTLGVRVLARANPNRTLLEGVARPALALLDAPVQSKKGKRR